ncbi:MAG: hypothetical protein IT223_00560 [Crocinitomicaceae bacterium]|nr:hypothetical protein [Crocinitomicaceae bacterium]
MNAARQNGRILFNESNTRSTPKKYHLQYEEYAFKVLMLSDSTAEIADVVMAGTVCDCQ